MKECLLCNRDMSKSQNTFGTSCLKKAYNILNISIPKNQKERFLYDKVMRQNGKRNLKEEQQMILLDRYLTLNILKNIPISAYMKEIECLKNDINSVNKDTRSIDLNSFNKITLNQSLNIQKYYRKYEDIYQKIMNGDFDLLQDISFDVMKFAFSRYYSNKPYMSDAIQLLQYGILKAEAIGLEVYQCELSAKLLEHSLKRKPNDITITEEKYINKIKNNINFKEKINQVIQKYEKNDKFDTGIDNETITFENRKDDKNSLDLFGAIHNCCVRIIGKKNKNKNASWHLDIVITDRYDFTELQKIQKYIDNSFSAKMAAISNNIASVATSCNVVHEYNIVIEFSINEWM